jgi:hypothetical protein
MSKQMHRIRSLVAAGLIAAALAAMNVVPAFAGRTWP